jgi:PTS system nitrogen regulatory IIA component
MNLKTETTDSSKKSIDVGRYIDQKRIIHNLIAPTKQQAIRTLVEKIFETDRNWSVENVTSEYVYSKIIERENIQTTGVGNGVAFPHARLQECTDLIMAVGISQAGIDFASLDKRPCNIICLLVSPERKPYLILQMMAVLARFFSDIKHIEQIKNCSASEDIAQLIKSSVPTATKTILARDLMRPPKKTVLLETSLEKATHMMHLYQLETLPVVDEKNVFFGEISCLNVFAYGVPEFFRQLQTVSFIKHLDPFEKYFRVKHGLTVKDLYDHDVGTISPDTTLMEIIFQMTAKNRSHLFVIEDGKLIGVINRFSIIDRILFF